MSEPRQVPCRGCGEPIIFIKSARNGHNIPCDPEFEMHMLKPGVVVVTPDGQVLRGSAETATTQVQGYMSHWATCPQAESFRKTKGRVKP